MLIRHSLAYLLARGLPGLVNLAAMMAFTRLLSAKEYGLYALVVAGMNMAGVILFHWQRVVLGRWYAKQRDHRTFLGETLSLFCVLSALASMAGASGLFFLDDPALQRLLAVGIVLLISQQWLELNLTLASVQLAPGRYGRQFGARAVLALGFGVLGAWFGFGVWGPLFGILFANFLVALTSGREAWRGVALRKAATPELLEQLRYGLPLILICALDWVVASSDRMLIGNMLDLQSAGKYAVGYDLAQYSLGALLTVAQLAAYPLVVRALEQEGAAAACKQLARNGDFIICLAMAGAAGLAALAEEISGVLVGAEFRETSAGLLPWVALGAAIAGIKFFHFDTVFHLEAKSKPLLVTSTLAAAGNLLLNLLLIPRFGLLGAAWATIGAYIAGVLSSAWLGRHSALAPSSLPLLIHGLACAITVFLAARAGASLADGPVTALVSGICCGLVSAAIAVVAFNVADMRDGLSDLMNNRRVAGRRGV